MDEESECTFKPKVNPKSTKIIQLSPTKSQLDKNLFERLYNDSKVKAENRTLYEKVKYDRELR